MERLQAQNFDLVKRINEQEARLRTLEADVAGLERDVAAIDEEDVESQEEMDKDACVRLFSMSSMSHLLTFIFSPPAQDRRRSLP